MENYEENNMSDNEEITTGVDKLLELLKDEPKMPLEEAAKKLHVSLDVVQSWVDFLVEEKIVGIEYKFTRPFIYLNKTEESEEITVEEEVTFEKIKQEFIRKAQKKNIPLSNIQALWKNHVTQALESRRLFFVEEANKRNLTGVAKLWKQYEQRIWKM